jgi:ribonuclease HII
MLASRYKNDTVYEAGIDEAGRGCFWGPMVAGAVIWPEESEWTDEIRSISGQIRDSKKVTPKKRAMLFDAIKKHAISWNLGIVEAGEIDALGMSESNRLAFSRAIDGLSVKPERLLIDGLLYLDTAKYPQEQIVEPKADGSYLAVAAASILAKEGRDRLVKEACDMNQSLNDKYGLLSSKGYGTSKHSEAIKKHGLDKDHRRLFLRNLLGYEIYKEPATAGSSKPTICMIQDA